ncbi:MAG: hypothetical protein M3P41_12325 [Actinomycetota bacterium]|nr:hypothetical protein [Actinomycetota bacterium]
MNAPRLPGEAAAAAPALGESAALALAGGDRRERPGRQPFGHSRERDLNVIRPLKTIVCFGDSNTWGYMPGSDGGRFPRDVRWPARLATALEDEAEVIAEGLNGRSATIESPVAEGRNGLPYLVPCLRSQAPVDLLVI